MQARHIVMFTFIGTLGCSGGSLVNQEAQAGKAGSPALSGSGGVSKTGGVKATGGARATNPTGGSANTGGDQGGGGAQSTGGSTGGSADTGGSMVTGGAMNSGGSPGTGGKAMGGSAAMGGALATGGSTAKPDAGVGGVPSSGTLPCDVQKLLQTRCDSCHGTTKAGGAPSSLVTFADMLKKSIEDPTITEAEQSLNRMKDSASPMPPGSASPTTAQEITTLQAWINAGYPSGSCVGDAGVVKPDPLNTPAQCTSKKNWTGGNSGSALMNPGQACISCHNRGEGPSYTIAGTLFPTGHEPNNCYGVDANVTKGAKVVVTGADGKTLSLTPNAAGNFFSNTQVAKPFMVKVVDGAGVERLMAGSLTNGDCNTCHTATGASNAPGRVTLP